MQCQKRKTCNSYHFNFYCLRACVKNDSVITKYVFLVKKRGKMYSIVVIYFFKKLYKHWNWKKIDIFNSTFFNQYFLPASSPPSRPLRLPRCWRDTVHRTPARSPPLAAQIKTSDPPSSPRRQQKKGQSCLQMVKRNFAPGADTFKMFSYALCSRVALPYTAPPPDPPPPPSTSYWNEYTASCSVIAFVCFHTWRLQTWTNLAKSHLNGTEGVFGVLVRHLID